MAIEAARLVARIGGDDSEARSAISGFQGFLQNAASVMTGILAADIFRGVIDGMKGVMTAGLDMNKQFETYNVQFGVLLGSSQLAKQRLKELTEFAVATPFELPEVIQANKVLTGFGLTADDVKKRFGVSAQDIMTIAGDVASGAGVSFKEMAGYIGKFSTGATGIAIERFQELGIVTRNQLASMGISFDKGGALIIKSQADLDRATSILLGVMKSKYGGMMDAQSKTFEGMVSNLKDWWGQTQRVITEPIFDVLKENLKGVLDFLSSEQVQVGIKNVSASVATFVSKVTDVGRAIGLLRSGGVGAAQGRGLLFSVFGDLVSTEAINVLQGVVTGNVQMIGDNVKILITNVWENTIKPAATGLWDKFTGWLFGQDTGKGKFGTGQAGMEMGVRVGDFIQRMIANMLTWLDEHKKDIAEITRKIVEGITSATIELVAFVANITMKLLEAVMDPANWAKLVAVGEALGGALLQGMKNALSKWMPNMNPFEQGGAGVGNYLNQNPGAGEFTVPGFQFGGTVPGRIGQPQLVMAHGGERITPASQYNRYGDVINIYDGRAYQMWQDTRRRESTLGGRFG